MKTWVISWERQVNGRSGDDETGLKMFDEELHQKKEEMQIRAKEYGKK